MDSNTHVEIYFKSLNILNSSFKKYVSNFD